MEVRQAQGLLCSYNFTHHSASGENATSLFTLSRGSARTLPKRSSQPWRAFPQHRGKEMDAVLPEERSVSICEHWGGSCEHL